MAIAKTVNQIATNKNDQELLDAYLQKFNSFQGRKLHNGDKTIISQEAVALLDLNRDQKVDQKDWKLAAHASFISQEGFGTIAQLLKPLIKEKSIRFAKFLIKSTLSTPTSQKYQKCERDSPFFEESDSSGKCWDFSANYFMLSATPTAELHYHYGPGVPIPDLYQMALNCVGPQALLSVQKCGRKIDWAKDKTYSNSVGGKKVESQSLDDLSRSVFADLRLPSEIIAEGQKILRNLCRSGLSKSKISALREQREKNLKEFEKIATYNPDHTSDKSFDRFRNIYKIYSSLVETAPPKQQEGAVAAILKSLSEQNIRYVEMQLNAPKEEEVMKGKPDNYDRQKAMDEAVEKYFTSYIRAIGVTNRELIQNGKNPVDLRLIFLLLKKRSTGSKQNFYQAQALVNLLKKHPQFSHFIVGIGAASQELGESPSLYVDVLQPIHEYNTQNPEKRLGITWHQGEVFDDIFQSIRWIDEDINKLHINRLGHGLSLMIDPYQLQKNEIEIPIAEYIDQLRYEQAHTFKHPIHIYVNQHEKELARELLRAKSLSAQNQQTKIKINYPLGEKSSPEQSEAFHHAVIERQMFVVEQLKRLNISIEANPTSNVRINPSLSWHPLQNFMERGVAFTINTDDPSIFAIQQKGEILKTAQHGRFTKTYLTETIRRGFDFSFAATIRNESLVFLRY